MAAEGSRGGGRPGARQPAAHRGHYGVGTIAAAHVLTGTPELLTPYLARGSFAVALTANRKLGYRAVSRNIVDLTDHAFTAPGP